MNIACKDMIGSAMPSATVPNKTEERQRRVRAGFVVQGTSLTAWCRARGVKHQNARKALAGEWKGPKASALIREILQAAGLDK